MSRFEYLRAASWAEAQGALQDPGSHPKGGGIDLWDRIKEGLDAPKRIVSLPTIPGGDAIAIDPSGKITIGALATLAAIAEHPEIARRLPSLAEAAGTLATPSVRNAATLGGNLCQRPRCHYFRSENHHCLRKGGGNCFAQTGDNRMHALFDNQGCVAVSAPSTGAPLAALGAQVVVIDPAGSRRTTPIEELFVRAPEDVRREVRLAPGELIERVEVPAKGAASKNAYGKIRHRETFDWPIVEAAVALEMDGGGRVASARVFLGSVAMIPWRAVETERALAGKKPDAATVAKAAAAAASGARALSENGYKIAMLGPVVERTINKAMRGAG